MEFKMSAKDIAELLTAAIDIPADDTDRLTALEQRVEALESSGVSRKCTCSKCTGLPDVMESYKEPDIEQEATPAIPPTPSERDYARAQNMFFFGYPSLPSEEDYALTKNAYNERFAPKVFAHSRFCAMHHTITAEERDILYTLASIFVLPSLTPSKQLMNEALPIIRRLANTIPVKEEKS